MNTLAFVNNLLSTDGLVIILIVTVFFGAKRLPELAKGMGSAIREFSKAKNGEGEENRIEGHHEP